MENVMSELIYKADKELLAEKGLNFPNKMFKNVNLGKYGKCDLIHFSRDRHFFTIDVISCNRDKISMSSFIDLVTCAKGIDKYLSENHDACIEYNFHIIAKETDSKSNIIFLTDVLNDRVNFYQYNVNINGLYFNQLQAFELPNEDLIKPLKHGKNPKLKSLSEMLKGLK